MQLSEAQRFLVGGESGDLRFDPSFLAYLFSLQGNTQETSDITRFCRRFGLFSVIFRHDRGPLETEGERCLEYLDNFRNDTFQERTLPEMQLVLPYARFVPTAWWGVLALFSFPPSFLQTSSRRLYPHPSASETPSLPSLFNKERPPPPKYPKSPPRLSKSLAFGHRQ